MSQPKVGDIVLVRWLDSQRQPDWTYSEPNELREHESVGFLSHLTETAANIRPHRLIDKDGDEQHFGDLNIPRCSILSLEVLR